MRAGTLQECLKLRVDASASLRLRGRLLRQCPYVQAEIVRNHAFSSLDIVCVEREANILHFTTSVGYE